MSCKASKRVGFSLDDADDNPAMLLKKGCGTRIAGTRKRVMGIFNVRPPGNAGFSPEGFLRKLGRKVVRVMHYVTVRRRASRKVSSAGLTRSRSVADLVDSQRAEAIEDCIEFLNSSSSLHRSNSVSSCSC